MAFSLIKSKTGLVITHHAVSAAVRGILRTTRLIVEGEKQMLEACGGAPPVYVFWHGKQMLLLAYESVFTLGILASHSPDGELVSRILQDFGHRTTRGSSTRGGARGLLALAQLYREGCAPAFAADGPRGPYHVLKHGAVRLAAGLGLPILPASAAASRSRCLGSWDRLEVVAPFATVALVIGPALRYERGIRGEALKRAAIETGAAIDACTARAEEMIRAL